MKHTISRKQFLAQSAGAIGSVAMSSLAAPYVFPSVNETLKIGYLPITDASPLLIAYAKGFFKEEGLKVDRPLMIRNWSTLAESFIANKFNLTHLLFPIPIWMRYKHGFPVKMLAWGHTNGSAITVNQHSQINSFRDLGGKQIAVPYWYSMHNMVLQMGLREVGLKPVIQNQSKKLAKNEVNLFILSPPEMAPALIGNKIDGYIVAEPFNALAELRIKAKIMRFVGDIWKNHPCCVIVMKENIVKENKIFTAKVINALVRAQNWLDKNREEAARIMSREGLGLLPQKMDVIKQALTFYDYNYYNKNNTIEAIKHKDWQINRIDFHPYPYPSATEIMIRELKRTLVEGNTDFLKKLDFNFVQKDLIDDMFVKEALKRNNIDKKYKELDFKKPWQREEIIDFDEKLT